MVRVVCHMLMLSSKNVMTRGGGGGSHGRPERREVVEIKHQMSAVGFEQAGRSCPIWDSQ